MVGSGCGGPPPEADSLVLITIDTWRADSFGAGGHPAIRTPHLDRLFRTGIQFSEAYTPVPTTLSSHTSILTGLWPPRHGVPRNMWTVPDDLETLAETLSEGGFATAAFVSSAALDVTFNLDQGFDVYDSRMVHNEALDQPWRPATMTLLRAARWWRDTEGRRFLWVHLFEPHFPYAPSAEEHAPYATGYRGRANGSMEFILEMWKDPSVLDEGAREHLLSLYYAEIAGLDRRLSRFLDVVSEDGRTVVVATSDHGESVGEHGLDFKHGPHVFPGDVRVPLVVHAPSRAPAVSSALVRTIDIPGTAHSLLGVKAELPEEASDLLRWVNDEKGLPVFGVASMPWDRERPGEYANLQKQRVLRDAESALVVTPWQDTRSWYDRRTDPDELGPGIGNAPAEAGHSERLEEWIGDARVLKQVAPDPRIEEQLRSIGYLR